MQQTAAATSGDDDHAAAAGPPRKRQRIPIASVQDYEETCHLGSGGFGVVTKARHRTTGDVVAIKRHHRSSDGEILREARFLDACRDLPFLVGYHGLARDCATAELCLLMEYVAGPTLRDYLRDRCRRRRRGGPPPPLPEPTVRAAMWQLLTCARGMHERGIIHRDIKPANILVGGDRRTVKICDLGLAIHTDPSPPPPRARAGTLAYMAPEVLLGRSDCDARVDAWSLGCVMAELVGAGGGRTRPVFDGGGDEVGQLWAIYEVLDMPGHEHDGLRELFPEEALSEEGFEVLSGLLAFDGQNRLTADAALKMPWFDNVGALELPEEEKEVVAASAVVPKKKRLRWLIISAAIAEEA